MKIIGYVRVSTDKQAEHGVSIEAQKTKLQQYCDLHDLELVGIIEDAGFSASSLDRPGIQKALSILNSGKAQGLLVTKLDRLTRKMSDLSNLLENVFQTKSLFSVADHIDTRTANGELMLHLIGSLSHWELKVISERTKEAMKHKRNKGEYCGGNAPYGFRNQSGQLVEHEGEQQVISIVKQLRGQSLSLRKIAAELEKRGFKNRTDKQFTANQIRRIAA